MKKSSEISIIGAGLVGSLLSIHLAKRGYQVTVFERRPDMRTHKAGEGRSINLALSNRGIKALKEVGLDDLMKKNSIPMNGRQMHSVTGSLTSQPYGVKGQYINSISRSGLNMALMDEAEKLSVAFRFDHRCTDVNPHDTTVSFEGPTGKVINRPDIIIGADGAFSAVRGAFQISDRFDYSQHYIEHGYKELKIPAGKDGTFQMEKNALHIWPRESFMLIALPNIDGTFTCTLFFPFEGPLSFEKLRTREEIQSFFSKTFPDALALMPDLVQEFQAHPTSSLVTIRCFPWTKNRTLLIGDAAHAIVPFFGQGMNAGFEDCIILNHLLDQHHDDWNEVLPAFENLRKPDADAIASLALDNFIEMRDLVADEEFLLRKKIEARLHELFPEKWIPLYSMVTFYEDIRYSEALRTGNQQREIMDRVMRTPSLSTTWSNLDFKAIVDQLTPQR